MKIASVKKTIKNFLGAIVVLMSVVACEYETIEFDLPDDNEPVSFAADILPIFNDNDNCTSCHLTGKTSPNLGANGAYNAIVPALINTEVPENSRIYTVPSGNHFKKYSPVQAAKVLAWIKQGALNN